MPKDAELMLTSAMYDQRLKYIYFILTATGACIGFAVTQTRDAGMGSLMIPLGVAVTCWAISFFCGCRSLFLRPVALGLNIDVIRIRNKQGLYKGLAPEVAQELSEVTQKLHTDIDEKAAWHMRQQFALFIVACISFLFWHVLEMWARTPSVPG